ncbi:MULTISPECIES: sigma-70 family RNA polymerase sigma factor [unclassified Actinomadura]|uniref:sigma-70 family RNA polymerase sigma factor n=1 Tax=unclassified Actinomadura TaxID=2626254 RepID=UPI001F3CBCB9|nr:sigma-70 family RNA polymerase sigma factor [Actinomadura sp. K4S16]
MSRTMVQVTSGRVDAQGEGVRRTDQDEFAALAEPFRRELLAHCYRMTGSADDAADLVQETYLRAWRAYGGFEGRSSFRAWMYKIATNVCLRARERRGRRPLPSGLGPASEDPHIAPVERADVMWLEPLPDAAVTAGPADPAAIVTARETLRLALVAGLQHLPPRQRAVFILTEALDFPAADVAAMLGTSVAAVKSLLQRARSGMAQVTAQEGVAEPTEPEARALLDQYMAAFENGDLTALEQALRKDAALEMTGYSTWFSGLETCLRYIGDVMGPPGTWRMFPTSANGQPAAAAYLRTDDGTYAAFGIAVLTVASDGIERITLFGEPALLPKFGFPPVFPCN